MPPRRTPHNCHANALLLGSLLLVAGWLPAAQGQTPPPPPRTVAESSGYRATSLHADVVGFLDSVAAAAPDAARRITLGASTEGRELAALVLARPPIESAHAWQSEHGERLLVLAIGNIHGGEVDGKEALLSLARDIAMGEHRDLLNDLAIVILPNYNPDGNERIGPDNRRGQKGPADGMGVRHNAMGLDLNRDFIKADAPETRALITFAREWDPHLFIDAHTTNGSYHLYEDLRKVKRKAVPFVYPSSGVSPCPLGMCSRRVAPAALSENETFRSNAPGGTRACRGRTRVRVAF